MAKLPFVVAPKAKSKIVKIGNEDVGILEIEKRGYLTVAEKSFVDSVMQNSDAISLIVRLATTIGRKRKISTEKAYTLIIGVMDGSGASSAHAAISDEYGSDIASIQTQMTESMQRKAVAATTILIQTRIDSDWAIEDTMNLHTGLLAEFLKFYEEEESQFTDPVEQKDEIEEAAEIVGK